MSAPRVGVFREKGASGWTWQCSDAHVGRDRWAGFGAEASIAAAADAGRAHLAAHHTAQMPQVEWFPVGGEPVMERPEPTYCRTHGVARTACYPAHGDPEPAYVAPRPLTWTPDVPCDATCCCDHDHCRAHSNPIQRTYDESRADA